MASVKNRDTKPEVMFRKFLYSRGLRYRINYRIGKMRPDLFIRKFNLCVFIHGCFWHSHDGCKKSSIPKTNEKFWIDKLQANKSRDSLQVKKLHEKGFRVRVIWECAIKKTKHTSLDLNKFVGDAKYWELE